MLDGLNVIDSSNLSIGDKRNLKKLYLKTYKAYISALDKGKEPGDVCNIVFKNSSFTCSKVLEKLGIRSSFNVVHPRSKWRDPIGGSIPVHETTVTVPVSLIKLNREELIKCIQSAKEAADREAEAEKEQAKDCTVMPRRGFRRN